MSMKLWKRNAVVGAIVLFVCVAVYLNWSYNQQSEGVGKVLGEAALVGGQTVDPLLLSTPQPQPEGETADPAPAPTAEPASEAEPVETGYFDSARLNRQQARDSALTMLQQSAGSETADEAIREQMTAAIETMAGVTVSEAQIENLVTAKGYQDCVAFVNDGSASVVVPAQEEGLSQADVARITEIVTDETGLTATQIKIIGVEP